MVKGIPISAIINAKHVVDLTSPQTLIGASSLKPHKFSEAEQLLLDEARDRFDFEQKSAAALHSKSTLFLSLTGVFAALITATMGRLLDRVLGSFLESAALGVFFLSLGCLAIAAILLGRSALSRKYQVIATPWQWLKHLGKLNQFAESTADPKDEVFACLRQDMLDAWIEAVEACCAANEAKAAILDLVLKLLYSSIAITFLGFILLILHRMTH